MLGDELLWPRPAPHPFGDAAHKPAWPRRCAHEAGGFGHEPYSRRIGVVGIDGVSLVHLSIDILFVLVDCSPAYRHAGGLVRARDDQQGSERQPNDARFRTVCSASAKGLRGHAICGVEAAGSPAKPGRASEQGNREGSRPGSQGGRQRVQAGREGLGGDLLYHTHDQKQDHGAQKGGEDGAENAAAERERDAERRK
jgi:hypothetical protein